MIIDFPFSVELANVASWQIVPTTTFRYRFAVVFARVPPVTGLSTKTKLKTSQPEYLLYLVHQHDVVTCGVTSYRVALIMVHLAATTVHQQ